jgi:fibronectin-binding autotransporter adhesin
MATWIGADGVYHTSANWTPADVPDSVGETAVFANTGAISVNITTGVGVGGFTFNAGAPTYTISASGGATLAFYGAGIVNNSGVTQNVSISGGGQLQFSNSSSAGDAHLSGGNILFSDTSTAGSTTIESSSVIQFGVSATAGSATITINSPGNLNFFGSSNSNSARLTINGAMLVGTNSGTLSIGSLEGSSTVHANTMSGGGGTDHILSAGSLNTSTTFSGVLGAQVYVEDVAFGLTKVGTGTLTLSGSAGAKYTLATTVSAGTLKAGVANVFSANSAYTVGAAGTLDLNGFSQTIASLGGTGSVTLGAGTLTVNDGNCDGILTGSGGLVKQGTGVLSLGGTIPIRAEPQSMPARCR